MMGGMKLLERWHDYWSPKEAIDTSPKISDEVKYTTCYMCACRCGIKVHLRDGGIPPSSRATRTIRSITA